MIGGISTIAIPIIIILTTFICGILIDKSAKAGRRKLYFLAGLFVNLGILIFFKYINFIITTTFEISGLINSFVSSKQGDSQQPLILQMLIPLGISYITFQAIGYLIELKRGNQRAEKNLGIFAAYLLFFPKLLSGPIERAHHFIPQLRGKNEFNYEMTVEGFKRILWGLFLKLVIANHLAIYTDAVFNNYEYHSGVTLLAASVFFVFQLYADFSGYTEIAIGSALILGYRLIENFNRPLTANSITDFWRRWHISLSNWLRDYIFLPISYSLVRELMKKAVKQKISEYVSYITGIIITMTICGIWHGASWNFVIFGLFFGIIMTIEFLTRKVRRKMRKSIPSLIDNIIGISFTFICFTFSMIFFRSETLKDAFHIINSIFKNDGAFFRGVPSTLLFCLFGISILLLKDFTDEYMPSRFLFFKNKRKYVRVLSYSLTIIIILLIGAFDGRQFIYFKF
ncbi:MAG: MBOAT family protein [Ignavibacteriae bacterium]|nr:MBOAT family protein [Ignavibacteriota bacterium]